MSAVDLNEQLIKTQEYLYKTSIGSIQKDKIIYELTKEIDFLKKENEILRNENHKIKQESFRLRYFKKIMENEIQILKNQIKEKQDHIDECIDTIIAYQMKQNSGKFEPFKFNRSDFFKHELKNKLTN